jgi:hypothetical protein
VQQHKANRHANDTPGNIGQRTFALGRAAQHHLLPQLASRRQLITDRQQHNQRDCLQWR